MAGKGESGWRLWAAALVAAGVGLQLGAFAVVLQTVASGISDLPFKTFLLLMQPIHLAIGVVEGLATAAVVAFVVRARPEVLAVDREARPLKPVLVVLLVVSVLLGGIFSWFASGQLDGLEWSIEKTAGHGERETSDARIYSSLETVQEKTAFLPDYTFPGGEEDAAAEASWPAADLGTSVSGLVGGGITLAAAVLIGYVLKFLHKKE
jgi:cobalt/nickel transport system permease protein